MWGLSHLFLNITSVLKLTEGFLGTKQNSSSFLGLAGYPVNSLNCKAQVQNLQPHKLQNKTIFNTISFSVLELTF